MESKEETPKAEKPKEEKMHKAFAFDVHNGTNTWPISLGKTIKFLTGIKFKIFDFWKS